MRSLSAMLYDPMSSVPNVKDFKDFLGLCQVILMRGLAAIYTIRGYESSLCKSREEDLAYERAKRINS